MGFKFRRPFIATFAFAVWAIASIVTRKPNYKMLDDPEGSLLHGIAQSLFYYALPAYDGCSVTKNWRVVRRWRDYQTGRFVSGEGLKRDYFAGYAERKELARSTGYPRFKEFVR